MSRQQDDELFDIKNLFYIGNYIQCIADAQKLRKLSSPEVAIQRDIYIYRSYLAQSKFVVLIDEIKSDSPEEIQCLKLLAEYLSKRGDRNAIVHQIDQKVATNISSDTFVLVAATIYVHEENLEAAYRVLHASESLEAIAFIINILLKIDRVDLAKKKLKEMQEKDDDATLTQLTQAWVNIAIGGDKLQEAYYIYQELIEKYSATPMLLNGQAVALNGQSKQEEADSVLQEAYYMDSNYPDVLINLAAVSRLSGKTPEVANRYLAHLKDVNPNHPYLKDLQHKENDFLRICQQYAPTNNEVPA